MHLFFISFDETNRICVCYKSIKATKLVQTSTIACSSSAMLQQHGSTRSTRLTCGVMSRQSRWNLSFTHQIDNLYIYLQPVYIISEIFNNGCATVQVFIGIEHYYPSCLLTYSSDFWR